MEVGGRGCYGAQEKLVTARHPPQKGRTRRGGIQPKENGIPATFVVFHMMFSKLVGKHAARIRSYGEEKMHVLKFFDVRGYLIMAVMMGGGIALRSFHLVPGWFIAFFYTGLGIALALAGVGFLVHYFHRDGYITCPVTGKVREG